MFCILLVIFAPKSKNFFDKKINKKLNELSSNKLILNETAITLDILQEEYEIVKNNELDKPHEAIEWNDWPDKSQINGNVGFIPIYMFSQINYKNQKIFSNLINITKDIPDIISIYFIKLESNAKFVKHKNWKHLNDTLRYIYCFNSLCFNEEECGIWVNGESKKLSQESSYIYDSSKEHSFYNNTMDDIVFLIIDIRARNFLNGYSEIIIDENIEIEFKKILSAE